MIAVAAGGLDTDYLRSVAVEAGVLDLFENAFG